MTRTRAATAQGLRPCGPDGPVPTAFVAARFRRYGSETVGGWASPILSAHRRSAAAPSLRDGALGAEPLLRAFTLIELLVVLGIILLLAAMLMPMVNGAKRASERSATQVIMHKVDTAVRLFRSEIGAYPYQRDYADIDGGVPWDNRLNYNIGTNIDTVTDLPNVRIDAADAEAQYTYLTKGSPRAEDLVGPPAASVFAFRRADIHPNYYWTGSSTINIRDNTNTSYPTNPNDRLAMAAMLNRMAGELARLEVFAGNVDVTGVRIADQKTATGTFLSLGRDNSGSKLLPKVGGTAGGVIKSDTKPGWANDYLHGELERRYRDGARILDAYGKPLLYFAQVHEGSRFVRTYMFLSVIYSCDLRTYGLQRHGRATLAPIDPLTNAALAADPPALPDPAHPRHSDRRTYAAPGFENDIELWSAGPDRQFHWMRDDARNNDNISLAPYDKGLP